MRGLVSGSLHISCGGVVYRINRQRNLEMLLLWRQTENTWHLPKGTANEGESRRQTAMREVLEETGFRVRLVRFIGVLPSNFQRNNCLIQKLTFYYLMQVNIRFRPKEHDEEHDRVEWLPAEKAIKLLRETAGKLSENEREDIVALASVLLIQNKIDP